MIPGPLVTIGVNSLVFFIISEVLPGFEVKSKKSTLMLAVAYSFLITLGALMVLPLTLVTGFIFSIIALIPLIGPPIASAAALSLSFVISFSLTLILLLIIDSAMSSFKMRSKTVAFIAAFMLAIINTFIYSLVF